METTQQDKTVKPPKTKTITIAVNTQPVKMEEKDADGAEIKAAAIAQGVAIDPDFTLFHEKENGKLKSVGDDDVIKLTEGEKFRAVAPDDNS